MPTRTVDDVRAWAHKKVEGRQCYPLVISDSPCGSLSLGRMSEREMEENIGWYRRVVRDLRDLCSSVDGLRLEVSPRRIGGIIQDVPIRIHFDTVDALCNVAGRTAWLRDVRSRIAVVRHTIPHLCDEELARVLRMTKAMPDDEFRMAIEAGAWFRQNDARGVSAREVNLPGFLDSKWLDRGNHRQLVKLLSGKDDLSLRVRLSHTWFKYLDTTPSGRRFDSHTTGDVQVVEYQPDVVVIVENQDSFESFPKLRRGICVFGSGNKGPASIPHIPWVRDAMRVVYWGDMDADGLQILNSYRAAGLNCESILMDLDAYDLYAAYGTIFEADGSKIKPRSRLDLGFLTVGEQDLYERLTDPSFSGFRRIEQERIPLKDVLEQVTSSGKGF